MSGKLILNGLPDSIRQDGWWLDCSDANTTSDIGAQRPSESRESVRYHPAVVPLLLFLIWLADFLFWDHGLGVSIALFAISLSACVLATKPAGATRREWAIVLGGQVICNLPVVEQVQAMSLVFTIAGIVVLVAWACYGRLIGWWQAIRTFVRVSTVGAALLPITAVKEVRASQAGPNMRRLAKSMILPVSVGLVFLLLLSAANPVLERFIEQVYRLDFLTWDHLVRLVFWLLAASLIWPYLVLSETWLAPAAKAPDVRTGRRPWLASLLTVESLRNSLFLFNLLFLVQTVMDVGVLIGGMSLPDGVTYAGYAHRGAYPLVATALLAGLFAVASYKVIDHSRFLKTLMLVRLGQNVFLVITAAVRLYLYVDAYSLTYLRAAAFIWMGLVLVGLALTIMQINQSRSVAWLVRSNLMVLMGTLYICCFVNFAFVIAAYNLRKSEGAGDLDAAYICGLGEQALPVIDAYEGLTGLPMCPRYGRYAPAKPVFQPIENWRTWGFRKWRLQVYLDGKTQR